MKRLMLAAAIAAAGTNTSMATDLIVTNAKVATMVKEGQFAQAVAIDNGKISAVGTNAQVLKKKTANTQVIDAGGRTVIPGLNDSHLHIIREGLNYNAELRWDGVTSLKRALEMLREQAARTPDGQWIKVVGGWNEYQFDEKRLPTLAEINEAVPDKPVFLLYLYGLGFLNKKGVETLGYDATTRYKEGVVELGADGKPTGLLVAKPNALILYSTLARTGMLPRDQQLNSTQQYYRELNRLGITSAIDAGGGGQAYPDDYAVSLELARNGKLTVRTSYYLFAQKPGKELEDYQRWLTQTKPDRNDHLFYANGYNTEGGGENLVWSAADFENFLEPRPDMPEHMEGELEAVLRLLVKNRWPFRIHATYGESIERDLAVIEKVNRDQPLNGLRWFFDHAETISDDQLARVKKLGGGIAVQNRMYFQGEAYWKRYGAQTRQMPPIRTMLKMGLPVGLGTDGTRVSSYGPWPSVYWAVTGKTAGGLQIWQEQDRLSRHEALQLMTRGSAWMSGEEKLKGTLAVGQYADLVILPQDYFTMPAEGIRNLEAALTVVNGKVVYAGEAFGKYAPPAPAVLPEWSPVKHYGGYQNK
ncbi:amidohydrolase family protein [Massilia dura]|uniref:Amidohydrolase family protein n=1 Tax=Pseudoduganella dura TaxID=321982 RepID=A0A6I3XSY5_9BURK|nr:amidohydrolase [Pseudoduganella dura]MUI15598.1 amidohydrolase family protein [Pseudoduganella dura]GGY17995.1 amidohydrolase [Pseudoduganella dura]